RPVQLKDLLYGYSSSICEFFEHDAECKDLVSDCRKRESYARDSTAETGIQHAHKGDILEPVPVRQKQRGIPRKVMNLNSNEANAPEYRRRGSNERCYESINPSADYHYQECSPSRHKHSSPHRRQDLRQHHGYPSPKRHRDYPSQSHHHQRRSPNCSNRQRDSNQSASHEYPVSSRHHRFPNSRRHHESPSPIRLHGSPSLRRPHGYRSPIRPHGYRSPIRPRGYPSPIRPHGSPSSRRPQRSPSPIRHYGSPSYRRSHRYPSPIRLHGTPSPSRHHGYRSPLRHHGSTSPSRHHESPSLSCHRGYPSPSCHRGYPSPSRRRDPSPNLHQMQSRKVNIINPHSSGAVSSNHRSRSDNRARHRSSHDSHCSIDSHATSIAESYSNSQQSRNNRRLDEKRTEQGLERRNSIDYQIGADWITRLMTGCSGQTNGSDIEASRYLDNRSNKEIGNDARSRSDRFNKRDHNTMRNDGTGRSRTRETSARYVDKKSNNSPVGATSSNSSDSSPRPEIYWKVTKVPNEPGAAAKFVAELNAANENDGADPNNIDEPL
ncbi:hypothetical protein BOX15_Mlig026214g5, partial [Macrostomum lignano]